MVFAISYIKRRQFTNATDYLKNINIDTNDAKSNNNNNNNNMITINFFLETNKKHHALFAQTIK